MTRSKLLNSSMNLVEESAAEASQRYTGFGQEFFSELFKILPKIRDSFTFYRNTDGTDDVWAIYHKGSVEFGVQLDPDIEVICVWDDSWHEEIGCWISQPVKYTINLITDRFPVS